MPGGRLTRRLFRIAAYGFAAAIALFCVLLLALRFVGLPRLEAHRDDIAAMLARELGRPVQIDAIHAGWDGWNPQITVQGLRVRDRAGAQPLIELPEVTGIVSWTSLLTADLRLKELVIDGPRLAIRRDAAGRIHVAGLEIDPKDSDESAFADWALKHRLIVVRNALLTWNDELRNAPQLLLDNVQFRLENRFGHHRFGLTGTPPAEVAAPIDFRGDLSGASFEDWRAAAGRVYLRLDYADVAAWSEWLPMPMVVESGQGALRVWIEFADGTARDMVADLELAQVRTRLGDLPALDLAHVAGRVTWQQDGSGRSLATRGLWFVEHDGTRIAPTDLSLRYEVAAAGEATSGRVTFNHLELAPLATLARGLPLPARLREDLARYQPRGTLGEGDYAWEGPSDAPSGFKTRATFSNLGMNAFESVPGVAGVSGKFEATQAGGVALLDSRAVTVDLPQQFAEPIGLDTARGRVRWERRPDGVTVRLEDVEYANGHAAGTAQGTWKSQAKGPGVIDLTARITRADVRDVHRYLPRWFDPHVRQWMRYGLLAGRTHDARLTLKGDLAKFPFADGDPGTFVVAIKAGDVSLDYADDWPHLTGIDADVRVEGRGLSVTASRGRALGATLGRTIATINDLTAEFPLLAIDGEAMGATTEFLTFIDKSPLASWIGPFTEGAKATGNGRLALKFELPLGKDDGVRNVKGDYQLIDNELRLPGIPVLAHVNGRLAFTERELTARDLTLETLGGPARVSIASQEGVMRVTGGGNVDLAKLGQLFDSAFLDRIAGTTDWQLNLIARPAFAAWTLESSLVGAALDLPPPLGKLASEATPLKIERRPLGKQSDRESWIVDYGRVGRLVAHRKSGDSGDVDRALLLLGKAASAGGEPERAGIIVRGDVESINADEWLALSTHGSTRTGERAGRPLALEAVDLDARTLVALGRRYDDMKLSARHAADNWRLRFASRQVDGTANWEPAGIRHANGRFSAQLSRLDMVAMSAAKLPTEPVKSPARRDGATNTWPELDVTAERFIARAGNLGRMELVARPEATDWQVKHFALINDAGRIDASGSWKLIGGRQQTQFDVVIDVNSAPAFLATMGLPNDVKGAPTRLEGQLEWQGSPTDFAYEALSGDFRVKVGAGQFTKIDPGVGKLLGVLSLQALPRRISLDFRDVFSEGFAFDTIAGSVKIAKGVMHTDDLLLSGPSAKVNLAGDVDLERETQALTVRVQPSLSSVVSTGAGAAAVVLLAANPLVGAAVGAGTLLAQRIMQDPIEQIFSYQYTVRGSWSEPLVERVGGRNAARFGETQKEQALAR